ncbi:sporulation protein YunB [Anaerotignum sp.]|uniref:sporulation protein YunB n=1 Tax=Anaerotignum sp. TaxID=2039241 RepID=UPI0028A7ED00|nr:sporulation protein YunB [Anaerotignum sp.]
MGKKLRKKNKNQGFISLIIIFIFAFFVTILVLRQFEKTIVPSLQAISHNRSMAIANEMIDDCIQNVMIELPMGTEDFLTVTNQESGTYSTNTQQINLFCTTLNKNINASMQNLPNEKILIPLGAASKSNFFANWGPKIPFTLMPGGGVASDYETSFVTAGINQVNYKIWINLSLDIQIVNPLYQEKITLTKKIMLVDTIIGGKVPDHFFSMGQSENIY